MWHPETTQPIQLQDILALNIKNQKVLTLYQAVFLENATEIDLTAANLSSDDLQLIVDLLVKSTTLISLNLERNNIRSEGAQKIAAALKINKTLKTLNVSGNAIGDTGTTALAEGIEKNTSLKCLNLGSNNIGYVGIVSICVALLRNRTLQALDLSSNVDIEEESAESILLLFGTNTTLTDLNLSGTSISPPYIAGITKVIDRNKAWKAIGTALMTMLEKNTIQERIVDLEQMLVVMSLYYSKHFKYQHLYFLIFIMEIPLEQVKLLPPIVKSAIKKIHMHGESNMLTCIMDIQALQEEKTVKNLFPLTDLTRMTDSEWASVKTLAITYTLPGYYDARNAALSATTNTLRLSVRHRNQPDAPHINNGSGCNVS